MGEDKEAYYSEPTSLETILDDEIYGKKETNIFKRAKQGIERFIVENKNKIAISVSAVTSPIGGYLFYQIKENLAYLFKLFGREVPQNYANLTDPLMVGLGCAGITYLLLDYQIKKHVGKVVCGLKEVGLKIKKEKNNFILRHKLGLTITTLAASAGLFTFLAYGVGYFEPETRKLIAENMDRVLFAVGTAALGWGGILYWLYDQIGKALTYNQKHWKSSTGSLLWHISKEDGLNYLEKESKKGNIYADETLSRLKKSFSERFEYRKKVIEALKKDKTHYGQDIYWLKYFSLGHDYFSFKRKKGYMTLLDMAMQMYPVNPDRAIRIINKLSNIKEQDIKTSILATRDYFLHAHGHNQKPHWQELRYWLEKEGKLKLIPSSEGRVSSFIDEFVNKNFIFKDYETDKSEKFFIESAIHEILKDSDILVETPIFFYDEDNLQKHIFIRNGQMNLREKLEQASIPEKREYFEKIIPLILNYQEKIHAALEKQGNEYVLNSNWRGEKNRTIIPVLDLEKNLMRRAFLGSQKEEQRLGVNEHLPFLINKIREYQEQNQYSPVMRFNHGDAFMPNITETLCIIDPRPKIAHPLYDLTHILFDPMIIPFDFISKKEKILEEILKKDGFERKEVELNHAFDSLYLHNALCHTGSLYFQKRYRELDLVVNELLEFSKGKSYEKDLIACLKNSPVKDRLKI